MNTGESGKPCCAQVKKSKNSDVDWTYMVSGIGMRQDFKEIDVIEDFWFYVQWMRSWEIVTPPNNKWKAEDTEKSTLFRSAREVSSQRKLPQSLKKQIDKYREPTHQNRNPPPLEPVPWLGKPELCGSWIAGGSIWTHLRDKYSRGLSHKEVSTLLWLLLSGVLSISHSDH